LNTGTAKDDALEKDSHVSERHAVFYGICSAAPPCLPLLRSRPVSFLTGTAKRFKHSVQIEVLAV
jgi:hypothetical protein